jgi:hypothetical protein
MDRYGVFTSAVRMYCERQSRVTVDLHTGALSVDPTEESSLSRICFNSAELLEPGVVA